MCAQRTARIINPVVPSLVDVQEEMLPTLIHCSQHLPPLYGHIAHIMHKATQQEKVGNKKNLLRQHFTQLLKRAKCKSCRFAAAAYIYMFFFASLYVRAA